ncbi:hypothetical protein DYB32_006364 [Aphanomyces invadans]|uniref:Uncharacterized protein n=1 Tax=Aphanomyces invadans TaxID=157072 RepID=A0A3R7CY97_9STRA|nr:hypothetical protein DYB32_006364 [Aphanomyces invadans]
MPYLGRMVEALSNQVELLQQRDLHQHNELDRLRRLVGDASAAAQSSPFQSPPPKACARSDQHIDEIEALRREKRDLQLHNCELEVQIQDAAHSIEGFSAAIEKLEDGYKTKEETWKRQIADLQQECDGLARTNRQLQGQLAQFDQVKEKLSKKEQALADLRAQFDEYKIQLTESTQDRKVLQTTQETLRATQAALDKAEAQNASLSSKLDVLKTQYRESCRALDSKSRQLSQLDVTSRPQGQSVLVRTLRDEVRLLKSTLEAQFRDEKTQLQDRIHSLESQVTAMHATLRQKDDLVMSLQTEALEKDVELSAMADAKRAADGKIDRLERELTAARVEMEQLVECRGFLGDNIETGFKELLLQDEQTDALERELAVAQSNMQRLELECRGLKDDVNTLREMNEQLRLKRAEIQEQVAAKDAELATLRADAQRVPELLSAQRDWEAIIAKHEQSMNVLRHDVEQLQSKLDARADYDEILAKLQRAEERLTSWQHAKDEVKARDKQMKHLLQRLEAIGKRNAELDEALQHALAQSKQDHVDMVALRARLKSSKEKQAVVAAEDKARDAVTMKHMIKQQLDTLQRQVSELQRDKVRHEADVQQWQRTQQHMEAVMETHTKELVAEIEGLQQQVAKATKKADIAVKARRALELEVHEKNSTIAKLHQAVNILDARSCVTASPKVKGTSRTPPVVSSPRHQRRTPSERTDQDSDILRRVPRFEQGHDSRDKATNNLQRLSPNPAEEMELLLKKLERISQQYT